MEKMGMYKGNKQIFVSNCSFCANAIITDKQVCRFRLPECENCRRLVYVDNVSSRVEELFQKLSTDYGSVGRRA